MLRRFMRHSLVTSLVCIVCMLLSLFVPSPSNATAAPDTSDTQSTTDSRALSLEGQHTAVAITSDNRNVVLAYYDTFTKDLVLRVHPVSDVYDSSATKTTIDSTGDVGKQVDLALTSTNVVVLSYYDETNGDLKYARCAIPCTSPVVTSIADTDAGRSIGSLSDIEVTSTGLAVIAHKDVENGNLYLTTCQNTACSTQSTEIIARSESPMTPIGLALTRSNLPIIAFAVAVGGDANDHDLKLMYCADITCSSENTSVVDSSGNTGFGIDIVLGANDEPFISYINYGTQQLQLAVCTDVRDCRNNMTLYGYSKFAVDSVLDTAIDLHYVSADRYRPVISYHRYDTYDQYGSIITCSNASCDTISTYNGVLDGYGLSMAIRANITAVGYYKDGSYVYNNLNTAFPITLSTGSNYLIEVGEAPVAFNKTSPVHRSIVKSSSTVLQSPFTDGASWYEYCFATSVAACTNWTLFYPYSGATRTGLAHNTTYYWQVRAKNRIGTTLANSNTIWSFTVQVPPAAFNKTAPTNNAGNQRTSVTLSWTASARATSYEYCIVLDTAACTNWRSTTARTATVSGLAKGKKYQWQVRAKNTGGTTVSSGGVWKFTTAR